MITDVRPEMLWERTDAAAVLRSRFGFATADDAVTWVVRVLGEDYGLQATGVQRLVISAHSLMVWVTTPTADRLMIKICRLAEAHESLRTRAALVTWLAGRGLPVAPPLATVAGEHQLLRDGLSLGAQPVLAGTLLDATDLGQVRAAGEVLASLHLHLAVWPETDRLADVRAVAGGGPEARPVPEDLRDRLEQRGRDLPELERQPVHADFRGANVLSRGGEITGVLDFEEARRDSAVVDLAHAICLLGTWYHDWQPMSEEAQAAFAGSYSDRRPLTDAEHVCLPVVVARTMLALGWDDEARRWLA